MKFKINVFAYKEGVDVNEETFYSIDSCQIDLELSEEEAAKAKQTISDYNIIRDKIEGGVKGSDYESVFDLGPLLVEKVTRIRDKWSETSLEEWEPEKKQ